MLRGSSSVWVCINRPNPSTVFHALLLLAHIIAWDFNQFLSRNLMKAINLSKSLVYKDSWSTICCPRDCVSRTANAPLKPLGVDSALRALSTLRGLRGAPEVPPLCRETQSLGKQMLNATVGINGLKGFKGPLIFSPIMPRHASLSDTGWCISFITG